MAEHIIPIEQAVCHYISYIEVSLTPTSAYAFPNDQLEVERLEIQNAVMLTLFGGRLYFAPFSKKNPPRTVLDIATGTGDWAIKIGDEFPHCEVTATDLSPIQPNNVPPNVNFYVEDSYVHSVGVFGRSLTF